MNRELQLMLDDFIEKHKVESTVSCLFSDELNPNPEYIEHRKYLNIYDIYHNQKFQEVFAYFHRILNALFEFMNDKAQRNNHYNADESRNLLQVIKELRDLLKTTNSTDYKIIVEEEYINKIKASKEFLQSSGGSSIPDDFQTIDIIKYKPIFRFVKPIPQSSHSDKQISTEARFDDSTISIILKKEVFNHVKKLLNTGNYYNAVEESYKLVREKLKLITGKEKAHEGFKEGNYQLIFGYIPVDEAEKDFFEGVKFLHMAIQKLRNEKAHKPAEDMDKNLAIHYIVLVSLAYDLIDNN